ncbi:hypothetical protein [Variovorax paradoxus]|uniref:hypothetical protein n=1 Tax=Variovorax paradoxus TaxID=34073 RepID=UPI001ABD2DF6
MGTMGRGAGGGAGRVGGLDAVGAALQGAHLLDLGDDLVGAQQGAQQHVGLEGQPLEDDRGATQQLRGGGRSVEAGHGGKLLGMESGRGVDFIGLTRIP